jgi:uncharacterized repeat protein (TIGR01451 family)
VVRDDLTPMLDDATWDGIVAKPAAGTATYAAPILTWTGPLGPNTSVRLEYALVLTSSGDGDLGNIAWSPGDPEDPDPPAPTCENVVDGIDPVTHEPCAVVAEKRPIAQVVSKTADDDEATRNGDTVTYSIVVRNVGAAPFTVGNPVHVRDDLSGVLDDAKPFRLATASDGGAGGTFSYAYPQLSWKGPLAIGASVTLTYSVDLAQGGDSLVKNVTWVPLKPDEPVPECPIPMSGARAAGAGGAVSPNCKGHEFPLPATSVAKSVAAPDPVVVGSLLAYTITVTNTGKAPYTEVRLAEVADTLAAVLDDAVLVGSPKATSGTVEYKAPQIAWSGALAVGASTRITYSARIQDGGDGLIPNVAWVPAVPGDPIDAPPPACVPPFGPGHTDTATGEVCVRSATRVEAAVARAVPSGRLPFTGADESLIWIALVAALAVGLGLALRTRRRNP